LAHTTLAQDPKGCEGLSEYRTQVINAQAKTRALITDAGVDLDADGTAYTSDDWIAIADAVLAFNRELRKTTPPDWAEEWHQALLDSTALREQLARSIATGGLFAGLAFSDQIEETQTRLNDLARDYSSFCPDFAALNDEFNGTDATPTPTPTLPPPTATSVPLMAAAEFDFTDRSSDSQFHVRTSTVLSVTGQLASSLREKKITPHGKFVYLRLEMTNIGTKPGQFYGKSAFLLRDADGRAFSPDSDATRGLTSTLDLYVEAFQPGLTYEVVLAWDVAPDARGFHLEIEDTAISVLVDSVTSTPTATPSATTGGASATPLSTVELELKDIQFDTTEITVPANTQITVTVTNTGVTTHNFTVPDLNITSGDVASGKTKTFTFSSGPAGQHQYVCTVPGHTEAGMVGTLFVK